MKALDKAIMDKFKETDESGTHNTYYTALSGRLFKDKIPNDINPPCAAFVVTGDTDHTFSDKEHHVIVTFWNFDGNAEPDGSIKPHGDVSDATEYCRTLFDGSALNVVGWSATTMYENGDFLEDWDFEAETWAFPVSFELWLSKSR